MANMSYCRFTNTVSDLLDCLEVFDDFSSEKIESESEEKSAVELLTIMADFCGKYQLIDKYGNADVSVIKEFVLDTIIDKDDEEEF